MNRLASDSLQRQPAQAEPATHAQMSAGKTSTTELASAIYQGTVQHRRHSPHPHAFSYRMAMLYLDLAEIDQVFAGSWLWSYGHRNLAEFRRSDYLGDASISLDEAVRMRVAEAIGRVPEGPIRLLTHLRYFGHSFNPVSFYYCFEADGRTLDVVVAEITNTPWKERHAYVLPVASAEHRGGAFSWQFAKTFHVSPFIGMDRDYAWRLSTPEQRLLIHMNVLDRKAGAPREFDATLSLERQPVSAVNLARVLLRFPLMTTHIVGAIHWHALRLWLKRNPVHDHPDKAA